MNIVIFYEKPGCASNAKQKKSLRKAGCMVFERSLLEHGMKSEELYSFLEEMPVSEWFNPNAPEVKSGKVDPSSISKEAALQLLMMEPILIKRPLMIIKNRRICGFEQERVERLLDIKFAAEVSTECSGHHESCKSVNS